VILVGAAAVMLAGSFLDVTGGSGAWGAGALPIITLIPIYGLLMAVPPVLSKLAGIELPERVFELTRAQLNVVLAVFAVLMSAAWMIALDNPGAGMWLMLIGSAGALYGALAPTAGGSETRSVTLDRHEGNRRAEPSALDLVTLVAGAVVIVGSLLGFYEYSAFGVNVSMSAWSGDLFSPVTLIPVLCAILAIGHVAASLFTNMDLPEKVLGLGWNQIHVALGFQATVMMIAFLIQDKGLFDIATGFRLMLPGSVALLVGAVGRRSRAATSA